ncbi:MAG TPA: DUF4908 domain-containing protein, partial [Bradyrhizobium sp.]|nr:DUF4908 domain-containing protein [Bradyrhizobium sp.]
MPLPRFTLGALFLGMMVIGHIGALAQTGPILRLAHYSTGNGMAGFILDQTGIPVKLRFDGSEEIVALAAAQAPGGAISLKRDNGNVLIRFDDQLGATFYGGQFRDGTPVFIDKEAMPLAIAPATKGQAEDKAVSIARQLKNDFGITLQIDLDAPALDAQSLKWSAMADTAMVVGIALKDLAATQLGHDAIVAKIERVVIRDKNSPAIELTGQTLVLSVVADKTVAGRPSSILLES